jgi:hypothetical protein
MKGILFRVKVFRFEFEIFNETAVNSGIYFLLERVLMVAWYKEGIL